MVKELFDNKYALTYKQASELITGLFVLELPKFCIEKNKSQGAFFSIIAVYDNKQITINSDRGILRIFVINK